MNGSKQLGQGGFYICLYVMLLGNSACYQRASLSRSSVFWR